MSERVDHFSTAALVGFEQFYLLISRVVFKLFHVRVIRAW